tara:strand:+ start:441 stop:581 length:141 start_codon:yes stop_codon:yes gene_type:complete
VNSSEKRKNIKNRESTTEKARKQKEQRKRKWTLANVTGTFWRSLWK